MSWRIGADIGGTFTDLVALGPGGALRTKKVSSSVGDYGRAIVEGLGQLFHEVGFAAGEVEEVLHATTIASNAILEHKGARTGLITTAGFAWAMFSCVALPIRCVASVTGTGGANIRRVCCSHPTARR